MMQMILSGRREYIRLLRELKVAYPAVHGFITSIVQQIRHGIRGLSCDLSRQFDELVKPLQMPVDQLRRAKLLFQYSPYGYIDE